MNLDIIVTHYKEPWIVGKGLFDSIAMQRMVNFDDIRVILVNDGEENAFAELNPYEYPFIIQQMSIPHGGVSKARNAGLDASDADWVMFCDFDDGFSNIYGLYLIFCAMNEDKYDTLWSCFTEETKDENGKMVLVNHDRDWVFIHGKAHRRQYLVDKGIRFHEKLTIHEDVFFTMLTQVLADDERVASIKTPFYVWKWNGNSVVRKDMEKFTDDYILMTYDHLIRQRIALTEEFIRRNEMHHAVTAIVKTVVEAYYDCQQFTWRKAENKELLHKAENWFAAYLKRYAGYYVKADPRLTAELAENARKNARKKGTFFMEAETLKDWLQHIMDTAKPIPEWDQNV